MLSSVAVLLLLSRSDCERGLKARERKRRERERGLKTRERERGLKTRERERKRREREREKEERERERFEDKCNFRNGSRSVSCKWTNELLEEEESRGDT
jgi:hypothetical protein